MVAAGLGTRFLRHIERTRMVIHLIDVSEIDEKDPLKSFRTINKELALHNEELIRKPQIIVLNKLDVPGGEKMAEKFEEAMPGKTVLRISALTGEGTRSLLSKIVQVMDQMGLDHGES